MLTELASDTLLAAEVVDGNETIGFIINKRVDKTGLSMCRIPDDHKVSYETGAGVFCTKLS